MERMRTNRVEHGRQTHQVLQSIPLDFNETGKSLKVQAERPHLVSLGSGRRNTLGSGATDIPLQGLGIADQHCYIENQTGSITLHPCGSQCSVDGLSITKPYRLTQGCMLCFGQSVFFRFNHPEEALRMKSMLPGGSQGPNTTRTHLTDSPSVLNGNHQSYSSNGDSKINNKAKNLQDSSGLKAGSGNQPFHEPSPPRMLNGRNEEESIYENSSSFQGQNLGSKTPPVPGCSPHTNYTPVPHPRTSLSVASSGSSGGQRAQESPKLRRNLRADDTSIPTPLSRGSGQGAENYSHKPSTIKLSSTAPSSPRVRGSSLQKRSPSPRRDQHLSNVEVPQRLRTPEPIGSNSLRELPPLSPYMSSRGTQGSQGSTSTLALQGHLKLASNSKAEAMRAMYAQGPMSLSGLEKEPGGKQLRSGPGSAIVSGLGSLSGSPLTSPRSQRKTSCMTMREQSLMKPYTRERKNSISEISDNEDELLEYHRWQREERMREQEMEKQERQRLETILHLCADYNYEDSAAELAEVVRSGLLGSARGPSNTAGGLTLQEVDRPQRVRENDEETQREESSSTESTHQECEDLVDDLKHRVTELELQLQETKQEVEMEQALLQAEKRAEHEQGRANVSAERKALEKQRNEYNELKRQIAKCPLSLREQLQEQLSRKAEALESGTKQFEELEFCQLEEESSLEEKKDMKNSQLLQERAEYHCSVAKRKEKMAAMEAQVKQMGVQASQDCDRMAKDRIVTLQLLHKEQDRLCALEKKYHSLTGGRNFPKPKSNMAEEYLRLSDVFKMYGNASMQPSSPAALHCLSLAVAPALPCEEYITVSQLSQIFGMQRLDPTSSSSFQLASSESTFSCHSTACGPSSFLSAQSHPELSRNTMAPINLERWYQDIMAAGEPRPCPPPLPAKSFSARRHSQAASGTLPHSTGANEKTKGLQLMLSNPLDMESRRQMALQNKDISPTMHHSILHHQAPPSGSQAYDTLSLESSDSMETSVSTGNSACTPESACGMEAQRIEEMEKMLKEAQQEKARLMENREREVQARRQMLEEERRRREEAERRLQDETTHRLRLVEEEVKMREKHFSQPSEHHLLSAEQA
ncbi:hypothetical protein KUCAC02_002997, partial [Chaenocephalus aceratus]